MTNSFEVLGDPAIRQTVSAVDALSQLLAMNAAIDSARAGMVQPYSVSANQVTEIGHPAAPAVVDGAADGVAVGEHVTTVVATALKTSVIAFTTQHSRR